MRTVKPTDAYDKNRFVPAMEFLSDLENAAQNVNTPEGNWNPTPRKDLGVLLKDNSTFYAGMAPDSVINDANEAFDQYNEAVQNYAIKNFSELLGKINGERLLQVIGSLPVVKTGRKNLDKLVKIINEQREIQKTAKEGSAQNYVAKRLEGASGWRKDAYFGYSIGNPDYTQRTFQAYVQSNQRDFMNAVFDKDENVKSEAQTIIRGIIRESYKQLVAKDTENDDKVAQMYLSAVARGAYESVKPEKKVKPGKIFRTGKV